MAYATNFWGTLKFTRRLSELELQSVEGIITAGRTSTPEIEGSRAVQASTGSISSRRTASGFSGGLPMRRAYTITDFDSGPRQWQTYSH